MLASLSSEVARQSAMATYALGSLPFSHTELERTAKFLSQVGDYAYHLARQEASGVEMTEEDKKSIVELSDAAYQLSVNLNELYARIYNEGISIGSAVYASNPEEQIDIMAETIQILKPSFQNMQGSFMTDPFPIV